MVLYYDYFAYSRQKSPVPMIDRRVTRLQDAILNDRTLRLERGVNHRNRTFLRTFLASYNIAGIFKTLKGIYYEKTTTLPVRHFHIIDS